MSKCPGTPGSRPPGVSFRIAETREAEPDDNYSFEVWALLTTMAPSTASMGWVQSTTAIRVDMLRVLELPLFLCPALARPALRKRPFQLPYLLPSYRSQQSARLSHSVSHQLPKESRRGWVRDSIRLPQQCAGCGAFSQTSDSGEPGFYSLSRKTVREFLAPASALGNAKRLPEREIIEASLRNLGDDALKSLCFNGPAAPRELFYKLNLRCSS